MSKVAFVSDTVSCLPPQLVKDYSIKVVPTNLIINGKSYRDGIDMSNDDFWKQFDSMQSFTTAAATPGDFVNSMQEAAKEADNIICTVVSRALSANFKTAEQARSILLETNSSLKIEILDSRTAIGAQGFMIIEGARAAQSGKNMDEVLQVMQGLAERVKWINAMETTKYLIKIGRAPKTIPTEVFLQVKPIICMLHNTGVVEDGGVARSKEESFQKMVDMIGQNTDLSKPLHIMVHHTNSMADGQKLGAMVKSKYNPVEMYYTPYTALLSGTTGPCNAVSFYA
jgi:DegV family protein with EDD domain